jgi:hypothetical protein
MLYDKWWKNPGDTCTRNEKGKENKANALGVDNIGGVFVVLLCGLAVAVIVAIFEFCYNSKRNTQAELVCPSSLKFHIPLGVEFHSIFSLSVMKNTSVDCVLADIHPAVGFHFSSFLHIYTYTWLDKLCQFLFVKL